MVVEMPKGFEAYLPRNSMYRWPRMLRYRWSELVKQLRVVEGCWIASSPVVLYFGIVCELSLLGSCGDGSKQGILLKL
jgi:hypothetical protein